MVKDLMKRYLQKLLGFDNYLYVFSIFSIIKTRRDKEFVFFMERIPTEGNILDIGANIGIMSILLAKKFDKSRIYAFEPMPSNLKALKRIIKHYGVNNVTVEDKALGMENGSIKMVMPVINDVKMQGFTHIFDPERYPTSNEGIVFEVPVRRLDDVEMLHHVGPITAIKIDVENHEYEVLLSGKKLLTKHSPIIYCELWPGKERDETIKYLEGLGYKTEIFDGKKFGPYQGQDASNFMFTKHPSEAS